jgi:7-keto-8-aminopelargonate synthetase-like enzyme
MMTRLSSLVDYMNVRGTDPENRYRPFADWLVERRQENTWPYRRILGTQVSDRVTTIDENRQILAAGNINYASQDYLGLVQDPRLADAAVEAVGRFGVHSSGSPALLGRSQPMLGLADRLCSAAGRERCILYPTGWAAGYGVIAGLVRRHDVILIDQLAHNCLQAGAQVCSTVHRFPHNDADEVERLLRQIRAETAGNGVFLVLESLYSMDADSPDLARILSLAREYEAIIILDVAHDFGAMGERGLGLLEQVEYEIEPDVIMGSFSKTFASNGGFVLCSPTIYEYLCYYSPSHLFSNALSPVQASVALKAAEIVFSDEGQLLRQRLMENVLALRQAMMGKGFWVGGDPSPIVPVFVGEEALARFTSGYLTDQGLLANLVEFPAVARGKARFRFQVMPTHSAESAETAADIMSAAVYQAKSYLAGRSGHRNGKTVVPALSP